MKSIFAEGECVLGCRVIRFTIREHPACFQGYAIRTLRPGGDVQILRPNSTARDGAGRQDGITTRDNRGGRDV